MSELVTEASRVLSSWPVVNGFFIIVITFSAIWMNRRGERERKNNGSSNMEIPMFLMGGPVHDVIGAIHDIAEESRTQNAILRDIANGLHESNRNMVRTHGLLENIHNVLEMRPARQR